MLKATPLCLAALAAALMPPTAAAQTDGSSLQPCLAAAADFSPVYPTAVFPVTSPELDAVFHFGPSEHHTQLHAQWVAVDVGKVAPPNTLAGESALKLQKNTTAGVLRFELRKGFPTGQYRLDVTADGKPWKSAEFQVVQVASGDDHGGLGALIPLDKGRVWTYAFLQEPGGMTQISKAPPGATLGPDGSLHATVTATVAGTDGKDARVAWARGGVPFSEEWWRPTQRGLAAVRRTVNGESITLDPPQLFFPWPAGMGRRWSYTSRDKTIRQSSRVWGPVPVKGPTGEAPGYVVLVEQKGRLATTVEREYLPGVGLVRSITITSLGPEMMSREQLVLTSAE
jgi:hypothetical protein